jgi:hypothetical protein
MVWTGSRTWRALGLTLALLGSGAIERAHADANGGLATALSLTAADGSMRTQTGVRLAISAIPGVPDRVVAMSAPVQARMGAVRTCFSEAMQRTPSTAGSVSFDIEATGRGARVKVTEDATGDRALVTCMRDALSQIPFSRVPRGSLARVSVQLTNPFAGTARPVVSAPAPTLRMLAGGLAESESPALAGDIKVHLTGSAYAVAVIERLQRDIATQIAGLLDCRRKAFRPERAAGHQVTVNLSVRDGALLHGAPRASTRRAPKCVSEWIERLDAAHLDDADLELAISFAR